MPVYTVIGWQAVSRSVDIAYFDARHAFDAARAAFDTRWTHRPDWRFVAAYAGKLRPAAAWKRFGWPSTARPRRKNFSLSPLSTAAWWRR